MAALVLNTNTFTLTSCHRQPVKAPDIPGPRLRLCVQLSSYRNTGSISESRDFKLLQWFSARKHKLVYLWSVL